MGDEDKGRVDRGHAQRERNDAQRDKTEIGKLTTESNNLRQQDYIRISELE